MVRRPESGRCGSVDGKAQVISWKNLSLEEVAVNLNPLSVAIDKAKMNDVVARSYFIAGRAVEFAEYSA